MSSFAREAELRRHIIERLITASLNDAKPAREANLQRWRALGASRRDLSPPIDAVAA